MDEINKSILVEMINQKQDELKSEVKTLSEMPSQKSRTTSKHSKVIISQLEKQLREEKSAKCRLKEEIEELKKMNGELCNVILTSK